MNLGSLCRPVYLYKYEYSPSFGPLCPFRNLLRPVTPSGCFRIRCCILPRRADLDRQIRNYKERRLSASFRLSEPF